MNFKLKAFIKKIIPNYILLLRLKLINKKKGINNSDLKELFTSIYSKSMWNKKNDASEPFYSGIGSRDIDTVNNYKNKIEIFLKSLNQELKIVDLGCGDFYVHSDLVYLSKSYYAVDIVKELIEFNKKKYSNLNVEFINLDITKDKLPEGNIILIREVLQHLSNHNIKNVLKNIKKNNYHYLIITEVLPLEDNFIANKEFVDGPHTRTSYLESAVDVSKNPFNLKYKTQKKILDVKRKDSRLVTTIYEF